jgi:hypothetical protein
VNNLAPLHRGDLGRRKTVSGLDWIVAGVYLAALVSGTLLMSVLARRSLKQGH